MEAIAEIEVGDTVHHPRFGAGEVLAVDSTTYSIVMVVARYKAGVIIRPSAELFREPTP